MSFSKGDPGPLGVPVDVFLAHLKAHLGHFETARMSQKALELCDFGTKNGQKWAKLCFF